MKTKLDIRRAIKERGYTVRDFAEKCNMTPANLSQIINGNPTVKKLSDLCEVLGCDVTDLFYPIDEKKPTFDIQPPDNTPSISTPSTDAQPTLHATTFCPHCGAKVRVGVVLMAE